MNKTGPELLNVNEGMIRLVTEVYLFNNIYLLNVCVHHT